MEKQLKLFSSQAYCIDASALFNLKGYPRDVFPTIWKKIETMIKNEQLISHIEVYKETQRAQDEISHWSTKHKKMFKDVDEDQIKKFQQVKAKYDPNYWATQISGTNPWGDPWVITVSICEGTTIITDENATKANRIPAIASQLGAKSVNRLDFFRQIGVKY